MLEGGNDGIGAGGLDIVKSPRALADQVKDGKFTTPGDWQLVGLGVKIQDGKLRFINSSSIRAAPDPEVPAVIGHRYAWKVVIDRFQFGMGCRCLFGGVNMWTQKQGTGVFKGELVATAATGLVFQALPGTYDVSFVAVLDITPGVKAAP